MAPHAETVQSSPPTYLAPVKAKTTTTVSSQTLIDCENQYAAKGLKSVPVVISRALGARMWDMEGKEYIDFLSSFSVVNQGHCHPRIIKRMIEQSQKVTLTSRAYHNEHYPLLCKRLCEVRSAQSMSLAILR
jgi:ornithine--oxo-acid transaminase